MCGICGELRFDGAVPELALTQRMMTKLERRGPDHGGSFSDGPVALGHRRLSIIDLSAHAHQPMLDQQLQLALVFNGTIYNYPALRAQLQDKGYHFFSTGDTEVTLKAYAEWGEACVEKLHGIKGGGTSSYHPRMMLTILVYGYCTKVYSSRKMAEALRENIHFMWLSGENRPDYRTINDFRGSRMKGVIDEVFAEVLGYLVEAGYIKLEQYFADGTKVEADANKHKVVWAKRKERYEKRVREKIKDLLKQIDEVNAQEQAEYGDEDLAERGEGNYGEIDSEKLKQRIDKLNERLRQQNAPKQETQAQRKALKELSGDCLPRLEKCEQQASTRP